MTKSEEFNTVAPLTNVGLAMSALERAIDRSYHLPGMVVYYGPSGYGKSISATYTANNLRAYHVECKSTWAKGALLDAILKEMGIEPKSRLADKTEQISEELVLSQRPLIIDEMDHIVDKKAVEVIRDIYEGSQAAMLLIGEEKLPAKLKRWERFHGRVLDWVPAQPASMSDAKHLRKIYTRGMDVADDLLAEVHRVSRGSVRRICVNLDRIRETADVEGWQSVNKATWANRELYTGEAPHRRLP